MAERPEDSRYQRPIVPDPEASLAGHRPLNAPGVRLWPLWSLTLLLLVLLMGLAATGWWYHQAVQQRLTALHGELSNVHARFDAEQGRGEALESLQQRVAGVEDEQAKVGQSIEERLAEWSEQRLVPVADDMDEVARLQANLAEDARARDEVLSAVRSSLDALERAGENGRATLEERIGTLSAAVESNESRLAESDEQRESRLSSLGEELESTQGRLSAMQADIEGLAGSREDTRSQVERLNSRLDAMQTELRDLRQAQLALSAQLESMRQ
ncbi:hypothetical protein OM427_20255 [Halomonas sp. 18H]|uniref:hypothetical protein n=1 Tax=Halomonas almeriensis TaxID=308163 RepID=UPI00222E1B3F|nr:MULTISPECIES: hypothetical protein [Halomonas]MCW4151854.1 hypothetical protein [Halomonas sp. 18H]MDN3554100.1 hypothetical protein [Halomonas almeriensis]